MKKIVLRFRAVDKGNFEALKTGLKKVETRAATVRYQNIQAGDVLVITCGGGRLEKTVQQVLHFESIEALFGRFPFRDVMPQSESEEEAKQVYHSYPVYEQKIASRGLAAFVLS